MQEKEKWTSRAEHWMQSQRVEVQAQSQRPFGEVCSAGVESVAMGPKDGANTGPEGRASSHRDFQALCMNVTVNKTNSIFVSLICIQVFHAVNSDKPHCSQPAHQSFIINDYLCSLNLYNIAVTILVSNSQNAMTIEIKIKLVLASILKNHLSQDHHEVWFLACTAFFVPLSIIST